MNPAIDITDVTRVAPPFDLEQQQEGPVEYYAIYRGQDGVINYDNPVATMALDDTQIVIPNQILPPNTIWHYLRRRVAACGLESPDSPRCVIRIDDDGEMIPLAPNPPSDLQVTPQAEGKFLLRWRYSSYEQETRPTGFNIYVDSGAGFNMASPDATVTFRSGVGKEFQWLSNSYSHGQRVKFIVRSYNDDYGESQNTNYISATANTEGPDPITGLLSDVEEL